MTSAWELIDSEHKGLVGRRAVVAKTFRLPDGSETVFTVTGEASSLAVACVALTSRQTVVLAEQYRPGPERLMAELRIIAPAIGRSICLEPVARRGWAR